MNRRTFLASATVVAAGTGTSTGTSAVVNTGASRRKPNIIFILADDLGYGDLRSYNPESKVPTPNLDRLATQGMRFTDAHSPSTVCTPTRYSLLTGRMAFRTGMSGVAGALKDLSSKSLGDHRVGTRRSAAHRPQA